jgi:hypothetical protein
MNALRRKWITFVTILLIVVFGSGLYTTGSVFLNFGISITLILFVGLLFVKPIVLGVAPPSYEFRDVNPDNFPGLDRKRWDEYSARLKALGFVPVRDTTTSNAAAFGIARHFVHPESNCYGGISQVFVPKAPQMGPPLGFHFGSYLQGDWSVVHGINKPGPGHAIIRLKHRLAFSRAEMSPEQLYPIHLAMRDRIAAGLSMAVVTPRGFELFQERANADAQARRDQIKRSNPVMIVLKHRWAKIKPLPNDWWGDYPKEFEARTGRKFLPNEFLS